MNSTVPTALPTYAPRNLSTMSQHQLQEALEDAEINSLDSSVATDNSSLNRLIAELEADGYDPIPDDAVDPAIHLEYLLDNAITDYGKAEIAKIQKHPLHDHRLQVTFHLPYHRQFTETYIQPQQATSNEQNIENLLSLAGPTVETPSDAIGETVPIGHVDHLTWEVSDDALSNQTEDDTEQQTSTPTKDTDDTDTATISDPRVITGVIPLVGYNILCILVMLYATAPTAYAGRAALFVDFVALLLLILAYITE